MNNNTNANKKILNQLNNKRSRNKLKKLGLPGIILIMIIAAASYYFSEDPPLSTERVEVTVDQYVDGDTTRFFYKGNSESFRYLIIDTPELNLLENDPEPFAEEAAERTKELLQNADKIEVEFDEGPETDNYSRYLAYVYVDGEMINETLVREGLAEVRYLNPPNISHQDLLEEAEEEAKREHLGIWSLNE